MLDLQKLRHHLHYDPDTGLLIWKVPNAQRVKAGDRFGGVNKKSGYRQGKVFGIQKQEHRLIWLIYHGEEPKGEIDHKNHIRDDNRLINLRDVPRIDNSRNQKMHKVNTSGKMGVSWYPRYQKWVARIRYNGKEINLGYFTLKEDAIMAREKAEILYGYHRNHGV